MTSCLICWNTKLQLENAPVWNTKLQLENAPVWNTKEFSVPNRSIVLTSPLQNKIVLTFGYHRIEYWLLILLVVLIALMHNFIYTDPCFVSLVT